MILRGLYAITEWLEDEKNKNFQEWGERNGLGRVRPARKHDSDGINATGGERDYADYDYPGPGLEAGFWDIPNM